VAAVTRSCGHGQQLPSPGACGTPAPLGNTPTRPASGLPRGWPSVAAWWAERRLAAVSATSTSRSW